MLGSIPLRLELSLKLGSLYLPTFEYGFRSRFCCFVHAVILSWVAVPRNGGALGRGAMRRRPRTNAGRMRRFRLSDALENLFAPHPAAGSQGASPCDNSSRTDKASRPVSRHVAIRCPVSRVLKDHPRALNPSHQIIRNSRTGARWTTDENPAEIFRRIDTQHLQQAAPLTLPNRGGQALG